MFARNIQWPKTQISDGIDVLIQIPCPVGSHGKAIWTCSSKTNEWIPLNGPNLSRCFSEWSHELKLNIDKKIEKKGFNTIKEIYSLLRREQIYGGDLINLIYSLSKTVRNYEMTFNESNKIYDYEFTKV